eukprot:Em0001g1716a
MNWIELATSRQAETKSLSGSCYHDNPELFRGGDTTQHVIRKVQISSVWLRKCSMAPVLETFNLPLKPPRATPCMNPLLWTQMPMALLVSLFMTTDRDKVTTREMATRYSVE